MGDDRIARKALLYGLGIAVGVGWTVSIVADILVTSYQTPYAVHGLMGIVVGSVFADGNLIGLREKIAAKLVPEEKS